MVAAAMKSRNKLAAWPWVALCTLAIFSVVPLARAIQNFVSARWGRALSVLPSWRASARRSWAVYFLFFKLKIRSAAISLARRRARDSISISP